MRTARNCISSSTAHRVAPFSRPWWRTYGRPSTWARRLTLARLRPANLWFALSIYDRDADLMPWRRQSGYRRCDEVTVERLTDDGHGVTLLALVMTRERVLYLFRISPLHAHRGPEWRRETSISPVARRSIGLGRSGGAIIRTRRCRTDHS